jgi:hypothetical protein
LVTLGLTVLISCFLPLISPARLGIPYILASLLVGYFFLLQPAFQLYHSKEGRMAGRLFDRASFYPVVQLIVITVFLLTNQVIGV